MSLAHPTIHVRVGKIFQSPELKYFDSSKCGRGYSSWCVFSQRLKRMHKKGVTKYTRPAKQDFTMKKALQLQGF